MIDMSTWETKRVNVLSGIRLDPRNVRLELESDAPESDIMLDLFKNEKALALVKGIVSVGYLTHEVPVAVRRDRKLVVVEGNRRVAALKAIQNPFLVPDYQARISALAEGFDGRSNLESIDVKVAPSQEQADQLIATLHTGNQRIAWTPARQAAFFQAQIEGGKSVEALRSDYPMIDVDKYILRSRILNRFRSVTYSTPDLTDFVHSRRLSISTLARIYESKEFIALSGLTLDHVGNLSCDLPAPVVDAIAEVIVEGMAEGNITTRSVNTVSSPRFTALMDQLQELIATDRDQPTKSKSSGNDGRSDRDDKTNDDGDDNAASRPSRDRKPSGGSGSGTGSRKRSKSFLDVAQFNAPATYPPSIGRILVEFSTLNVDKHPNAALDLLRTLLEKTIKSFAEEKEEDLKRVGHNGYVYLRNCLDWLESWFQANGPKSQVQVVKLVRSGLGRDFEGSQDLMNAINHNHHIFAEGDDVRSAWDRMRSLIAEMLK